MLYAIFTHIYDQKFSHSQIPPLAGPKLNNFTNFPKFKVNETRNKSF